MANAELLVEVFQGESGKQVTNAGVGHIAKFARFYLVLRWFATVTGGAMLPRGYQGRAEKLLKKHRSRRCGTSVGPPPTCERVRRSIALA